MPGDGPDHDLVEALLAVSEEDERRVSTAVDEAEVQKLRRSTTTNRAVATAMGILMGRHRVDVDEAFGLLVTVCQRSGRRLAEVSAELVSCGTVVGEEALVGVRPQPGDQDHDDGQAG